MITHRGFLAVYEEGRDADSQREEQTSDDERRLPALKEGDTVTAVELEPEGHSTNPPARYTEASLVRALEERGIGRPSTYASILGTIVDRGYVFKRGTALVPSFLAFSVVKLMERHFADLVDYSFTARMEEVLDTVAGGRPRASECWKVSTSATPPATSLVCIRSSTISARSTHATSTRSRSAKASCFASGATDHTSSAVRVTKLSVPTSRMT